MGDRIDDWLREWGPDFTGTPSRADAQAVCRRIAGARRENFVVLSRFVPADRVESFAALYAFCRWSDDLGDESGDVARATERLEWWREETRRAFAEGSSHPIFVALAPAIERHELPHQLFDDLIDAFLQDQTVTRYDTWTQLLDYCRRSANPVGRLVLMLLDESRDDDALAASDAICTALQLANHWQDIRRDFVERDRIYLPADRQKMDDFEARFRTTIEQGYAADATFLQASREAIKGVVNETGVILERGMPLFAAVEEPTRPLIWLFVGGATHVLRTILRWNCETVLQRPKVSRLDHVKMLVGTRLRQRFGVFSDARVRAATSA